MKQRFLELFSELFDVTSPEHRAELFNSSTHSLPVRRHRACLLSKRIWLFSFIFGIFVPLWIVVDMALLPSQLWQDLAWLRIISGIIFLTLAYRCRCDESALNKVLICLCVLLYTPFLFFLISDPIIARYQLGGIAGGLSNLYSLMPFVVVAALSIFPLTIIEFFLIATPVVAISVWSLYPADNSEIPNALMQIWLILLIIGSSFFSSISQMRYMISQVTRASYDALTNAMTRRAGIEFLELSIRMSQLQGRPLSLVFLDLDHFKSLNDQYGHDAGDHALKDAVASLLKSVRKGDTIIRWGGEEFLILLPNADVLDSHRVIQRIAEQGLGDRPDGKPLTASMGLTEVHSDDVKDWRELVEIADNRMYEAKQSGRARCVGYNNDLIYEM